MTLTCVTCGCIFDEYEHQRTHYKTDWHRYNLKRKVAHLPPLPLEIFTARRTAARKAAAAKIAPFRGKCVVCNKTFSNKNQYKQHLASKKHIAKARAHPGANGTATTTATGAGAGAGSRAAAAVATAATTTSASTASAASAASAKPVSPPPAPPAQHPPTSPIVAPTDADDDADMTNGGAAASQPTEPDATAVSIKQCLFCPQKCSSVGNNVQHMVAKHNFHVPDTKYLVDRDGFLGYLAAKVRVGHICLVCQRAFGSAAAVQSHMADLVHTRVAYEEGVDRHEFVDYYKYPRSKRPGTATGAGAGAGAGGDSGGDESEDDEDFAEILPTGDLHVGAGRTAGHRMYRRFYQQKLPVADERASTTAALHAIADRTVTDLAHSGRRSGSTALVSGTSWTRKTPAERRALKLKQKGDRIAQKIRLRVQVKANKVGQKHYIEQNLF